MLSETLLSLVKNASADMIEKGIAVLLVTWIVLCIYAVIVRRFL